MSVSAETYIVISLMFAVFAAVAAVGTSVVLGAGFERLRAGFEVVRKQSGFFADAIYKLDQRTQKLDEAHASIKGTVTHLGERVERVEKTATFLADGINSLEQRILQGSPSQPQARQPVRMMNAIHTVHTRTAEPKVQKGWVGRPPVREQRVSLVEEMHNQDVAMTGLYRDFPEEAPASSDRQDFIAQDIGEPQERGITTLLAQYFMGEGSGGSKVVYH